MPVSGNTNVGAAIDESVILEDIRSAEEDRIITGIWDSAFGGGIVRESITLLGGLPGAGKSTMLLQMAEIFCLAAATRAADAVGGDTIYVAGEEALPPIRARADRLGIRTNRRLRFIPAMGGVTDMGALIMHHQPSAMIIDSIDSLVGQDDAAEIKMLEILKKYSTTLKAPVLVISQVNKDGDYSGLMAKQHAVDVLMTLSPNESIKSDNGEAIRELEVIKNRYGRAFTLMYLEMTTAGLVPVQIPDPIED